jgi:hypothetical protein
MMARATSLAVALVAVLVVQRAEAGSFHVNLKGATIAGSVSVSNVHTFGSTKVTLDSANVAGTVELASIQDTTLEVLVDQLTTLSVSVRDVVVDVFDSLVIKNVVAERLEVKSIAAAYFKTLLLSEVYCTTSVSIDLVDCVEQVWMSNVHAPDLIIFGSAVTELTWCVLDRVHGHKRGGGADCPVLLLRWCWCWCWCWCCWCCWCCRSCCLLLLVLRSLRSSSSPPTQVVTLSSWVSVLGDLAPLLPSVLLST